MEISTIRDFFFLNVKSWKKKSYRYSPLLFLFHRTSTHCTQHRDSFLFFFWSPKSTENHANVQLSFM